MPGSLRTHIATIRLGALLIVIAASGMALDPQSPTSDYIRTDFTVEDGLPSNVINAIVQTRNGFLWVGTDAGLVRFNGRRFTAMELRPPQRAQGSVRALVEGPDGALWVGTGAGLARIPRAALDVYDQSSIDFLHPASGSSDEITCLRFAPDGSLWVGTEGGLYRFENRRFESVLPGVIINRIEKAADGHLLVITKQGLVEWDGAGLAENGALAGQLDVKADQIFDVFEDRHGARWFCTLAGLARREHDKIEQFPVDPHPGNAPRSEHNVLRAEHAYEDDQGTMWVQFAGCLYRISGSIPEPLVQSSVRDIYSDRDGDLWAGTNGEGLLRFKDRSVRMFYNRGWIAQQYPHGRAVATRWQPVGGAPIAAAFLFTRINDSVSIAKKTVS